MDTIQFGQHYPNDLKAFDYVELAQFFVCLNIEQAEMAR